MAKAGTLSVKIIGDTAPFTKKMKGLSGTVGKTMGKIAKVGAVAFAAVGAAAVGGAFKVASFGDEIAKSAGKAGLGVEQFQELRFAFGQGGVEAATMDTALLKFNKRLGESATGVGTADDAFESLNVKLTDADGKVRGAGGAMDEILPKLAAIESDAERAALAGDLFGQRAGPELAAALSDGVEGIDEARQKAQDLGIVMSGPAAEAAEKFTDQFDDIKQAAGGLLRSGFTPVMGFLSDKLFPYIKDTAIPALRDLGAWFGEHVPPMIAKIKEAWDQYGKPALAAISGWWDENGQTIIDKVGELKTAITEWIEDVGPPIKSWVENVLGSVSAWWAENGPTVIAAAVALKDGIVTAIAAVVTSVQFVVKEWDKFKVAIGIAVAIMIPHFVALGVAAVVSSVKQIAAWVATNAKAIASAVIHSAQVVIMVAKWVAHAVAATVNAAIVVAGWVATSAAAVAAVIIGVVQFGIMIAKWVLMGVVATANAAVVAAAWLIALGPIGLLVAAVIAAVVLIVANWDKIKAAATALKDWVVEKFNALVAFVRELPGKIASAASGMWDGIKSAFRSAVNWIIDKWNALRITLGGQRIDLPFGMGFSIPSITLNTPNIPRLHTGGTYTADHPGGEGLAVIRDGERVSTPTEPSAPAYMRMHPDDLRTMARMVVQISRAA